VLPGDDVLGFLHIQAEIGNELLVDETPAGLNVGTMSGGEFDFDCSESCVDTNVRNITGGIVTLSFPGAVPEPGAWALMLVGVAGAGAALRSGRQRRPAAA